MKVRKRTNYGRFRFRDDGFVGKSGVSWPQLQGRGKIPHHDRLVPTLPRDPAIWNIFQRRSVVKTEAVTVCISTKKWRRCFWDRVSPNCLGTGGQWTDSSKCEFVAHFISTGWKRERLGPVPCLVLPQGLGEMGWECGPPVISWKRCSAIQL